MKDSFLHMVKENGDRMKKMENRFMILPLLELYSWTDSSLDGISLHHLNAASLITLQLIVYTD